MSLLELSAEEQAAAASMLRRDEQAQLAQQALEFGRRVQRTLLQVADACQALLDAGEHPAVAAAHAREQAQALEHQWSQYMTAENQPRVVAALEAAGYPAIESQTVSRLMAAALARLVGAAKDGATIAADLADLTAAFHRPSLLWS